MEGYTRIAGLVRNTLRNAKGYVSLSVLDQFSSAPACSIWDSAHGYAQEVQKVIELLARRPQTNVLLVGQEGVGSLGVAKEVAERIRTSTANSKLLRHLVLFVDAEELLAGSRSGVEQLHSIARVVSEMERMRNIVVVLHNLKHVFGGKYTFTAEDVLHPFFSSPSLRTITLVSDEEYNDHIALHRELPHLIEVVSIRDLSSTHIKEFLKKSFDSSLHAVIDEVVTRAEHILQHIPYPKRVVQILQDLIAENTLSPEHVTKSISKKVGFDIRRLEEAHLLDIEKTLHQKIVNQERAIEEIATATKRSRAKNQNAKRPLASLLFTGPYGVGKTEVAKSLAQIYFGSPKRIAWVDMTSYNGELPTIVAEHSYSVLVIENFDKASSYTQRLFASALADGYVADSFGRKYFTTHLLVIAMSSTEEQAYSPALLKSFDGVITFVPLRPEHVCEVARKILSRFNARLQMEHDVSIEVTDDLVEYLAKEGYNEEFGTRSMEAIVQETVGRTVDEMIRKGSLMPGQRIAVDSRQFA